MRPALDSRIERLRRCEEVLALRMPANLYIMTDDGTSGDEVLARVNPASAGKVRFWRNGLDLERLQPAGGEERAAIRGELGLPHDAFILLTASRLAAWKRVDRAVAALPRVIASAPSAMLVIVGDGEERASLERQVRELGLEQHVRFAGAVPQTRVRDYMLAADVLLAVADLSNVGNPLLEAMCCGLAIVAVDAGETREMIRDRETGRLLPSGQASAIGAAAVELAGSSDLRARLGAGARAYAEAHFWSWDDRLRAELDDVERLVGARPEGTLAHDR
jgi:glycosyltransferase involved in cell wall biosynthesis